MYGYVRTMCVHDVDGHALHKSSQPDGFSLHMGGNDMTNALPGDACQLRQNAEACRVVGGLKTQPWCFDM